MIDLGGNQLVEHVHGGSKEDAQIGLTCFPAEDFRQEGLAGAGIADQDDIGTLADEIQVEKMQNLAFDLLPGLVMLELERLDSGTCLQLG